MLQDDVHVILILVDSTGREILYSIKLIIKLAYVL